jgi:hypothetical protein
LLFGSHVCSSSAPVHGTATFGGVHAARVK